MGTIAQRNGMSLEQFQAALTRDGLSYADAREQVRREMVISRVRQRRVAERIQVSEQEVKNFLASDMGKIQLSEEYRLANILIPVPEAASSDVIQAAARQAQELYQQLKQGADFGQLAISRSAGDNALEGGEIGWRKAAQLPQPFDSMIGSLAVGDVTRACPHPPAASSSSSWKRSAAAARWSVTRCMSAISCSSPAKSAAKRRPRSCAEAVRAHPVRGRLRRTGEELLRRSGFRPQRRDLNWIDPEALVPEFRQVMNDTPQGELSKPFRSQFGWHILQVLGRRATDSSEKFREQQAVSVLRNRKYDEELQAWLRQIRDEAYVEIKQ